MKKHFLTSLLALGTVATANAALWIDFGRPGQVLEAGYVGFDDNHESATTGASQNFATSFANSGAASVDIAAAWANTTDNRVKQIIVRGAGNNATWTDTTGIGLVQDWIGSDTRTGNGGNGNWDGTAGIPTFMTLTLSGLPAGTYDWTSFHHDTENIHGNFKVSVNTGAGADSRVDGYTTDGTTGGNPNSETDGSPGRALTFAEMEAKGAIYTTSFTADGTNPVVVEFVPISGVLGNAVHNQFFVMNGFQLDQQAPPSNSGKFAITKMDYAPDTDTITITWPSVVGQLYSIDRSADLSVWDGDLADSVPAALNADETSYSFAAGDTSFFVRVRILSN
jgi:hypothetical protein